MEGPHYNNNKLIEVTLEIVGFAFYVVFLWISIFIIFYIVPKKNSMVNHHLCDVSQILMICYGYEDGISNGMKNPGFWKSNVALPTNEKDRGANKLSSFSYVINYWGEEETCGKHKSYNVN